VLAWQCLGQYDPGLVQMEREGHLDDPSYIEGLAKGDPLKARENVFAFSMDCASKQVLQMLAMILAPLGQPNPGAQLYHFVGNITGGARLWRVPSRMPVPTDRGLGRQLRHYSDGVSEDSRKRQFRKRRNGRVARAIVRQIGSKNNMSYPANRSSAAQLRFSIVVAIFGAPFASIFPRLSITAVASSGTRRLTSGFARSASSASFSK
jgi:hypothetical protein